MFVIYSPHHILHNPPKEFISNHVVDYGESPERAELIFEALMDIPQAVLTRAEQFDLGHFYKIHASAYIRYLQTAYDEWVAAGLWIEGIMPEFFALGKLRDHPPSKSPEGKAGFYMTDSCTMIVKGTWEAVRFSGFTALTGAKYLLKGESSVFSLCRPPGHHAGFDFAGGYCFVNNSALAAKYLQDHGELETNDRAKVGILDIDFHHGNGTQDIVQHLDNILLVSIHGDPDYSYPYLTGFESENSSKNINFPLPPGIADEDYFKVFRDAISSFKNFGAQYLVISLGVDTFENDQLGNFMLSSEIYTRLAEYLIKELSIPKLIVMEGGYNTEFLATNVVSFLMPFINLLQKDGR
ncbi:MAG: histone deacetylase family protein [Bacteroidota bacterium]